MSHYASTFFSAIFQKTRAYCLFFPLIILNVTFAFLILSFTFLGCPYPEKGTTIRLAYLQSDLHHLPLFVAIEKGFFREEGLKFSIAGIFKAGPELMSAFGAGELDIGYVGQAPATVACANSVADIKFIAQVNLEGSAIVVQKKGTFKDLKQLENRLIAIPGHATMQDFLLRKALKDRGIPLHQAKIIVLKPPEMIPALRTGSIDAFIAWEPYPSKAVTEGIGKILLTSHDIWKNHPCCVLVAERKYFESHPKTIKKIKNIHNRSCSYINTHNKEAVAIGVQYTGMDKITVEKALSNIQFTDSIDIQKAGEYIDFLNKLTYISVRDIKKFIKNAFDDC